MVTDVDTAGVINISLLGMVTIGVTIGVTPSVVTGNPPLFGIVIIVALVSDDNERSLILLSIVLTGVEGCDGTSRGTSVSSSPITNVLFCGGTVTCDGGIAGTIVFVVVVVGCLTGIL